MQEIPSRLAPVYGVLRARAWKLKSPAPDDAVQEVLARTLKHADAGDALREYTAGRDHAWDPRQLFSFLLGTLLNVVYEQRREAHRTTGDSIPEAHGRPDGESIRSRSEAALECCLGRMGPKPRRAILLQAQGMKYDEIAREMGSNANTVASWIKRGREQLESCMKRRLEAR